MIKLSIFKNFNLVVADKDIKEITEIIKSVKFKQQIEQLRLLVEQGNEKKYGSSKKILPAFTPSGRFEGGRKPEFLKEYSGIIVLDIDKSGEETVKYRDIINSCPYTYCCFISPGGNGLKILVKVDTKVQQHKTAFNKVKNYYEKLINFAIDPSGKDFTRLCFFSYDPDLYLNEKALLFGVVTENTTEKDIDKLIVLINSQRTDITSNYEDWCNIGFAIENEFGEMGRSYFHEISRYNPDYNNEHCNNQYSKCLKSSSSGITIKSLFHIAKQHGLMIKGKSVNSVRNNIGSSSSGSSSGSSSDCRSTTTDNTTETDTDEKTTTNRFTITEKYLKQRYIIRYNVVSKIFEYKEKDEEYFKELNDNNLFIQLQKGNINISQNHLIALLKSDFVVEYNPFTDYFENLAKWDGETDYIQKLCSYLQTTNRERLEKHFKKWIVRLVKTAVDDNFHNKQALVLVSNKQNSGKSTFCRFLCPYPLKDYIVENIGTDKDSQIALTENFIINLDELSTAEKNEINILKSMFSKDKIKARLTYDKRASVHVRRASFIGSTDRWEFLTDENGSVRWLCFDISYIDWKYSKEVNIDNVYMQAYHLLNETSFEYELTPAEIEENDKINKQYQVTTPERELIQQYLVPAEKGEGIFLTATDILEYINQNTTIKLTPERIGKELKFLGFDRSFQFINGNNRYGYYINEIETKNKN